MSRADQLKRRKLVLSEWYNNEPAITIAERAECSESNVHRIVREYSDPLFERDEREVELKRAQRFEGAIVKSYNEGGSIDQIAKQLGLMPREVRAVVYLAIQRGEIKAYQR